MNLRILFLAIFILSTSVFARSQDFSIIPFAKIQGAYGSFTANSGDNSLEQSVNKIFDGFDYSFTLGGTILRGGNDIYKESFFDIYLVHKRISGSSNAAHFTGIGAQCRYKFFYGGIAVGMAGNKSELPIAYDVNSDTQLFGDLHGVTPMFSLGIRAPINPGHTLFLDIPFDFVISRNRLSDEPLDHAALYEWYSIGIGLCYFLSFRG